MIIPKILDKIKVNIVQAAAKRGLQLEVSLAEDLVITKTVLDETEVMILARIRIPRRKRSHPEVTILPNPYANSIVSKVKESIIEALNAYSSLLP